MEVKESDHDSLDNCWDAQDKEVHNIFGDQAESCHMVEVELNKICLRIGISDRRREGASHMESLMEDSMFLEDNVSVGDCLNEDTNLFL
jgi:hypothetical protein